MKYRPHYPDGAFLSLEAAQAWVDAFVAWYNEDHYVGTVVMRSPGFNSASSWPSLRTYCA